MRVVHYRLTDHWHMTDRYWAGLAVKNGCAQMMQGEDVQRTDELLRTAGYDPLLGGTNVRSIGRALGVFRVWG